MRYALPWLLFLGSLSLHATSVFTVEGRQILLDGEPFSVKGICYNPTQIGMSGEVAPFSDFYTLLFLGRTANDMVNLRRMGANTIRGYGWTPGSSHTAFMDRAFNGGENPIYMFINRWINPNTNWGDANAVEGLKMEWTQIAEDTKDHPATIGYLIGNEHNKDFGNGSNPQFWQAMETIAAAIKEVAPDKLVSVPITDRVDQVNRFDETLKSIDFWSLQVYRGTSFGSLFDDFAEASDKPLVITEFGYDAFNHQANSEYPEDAAFTADVVEGLIVESREASDVCAGVIVFAYRDEWWKAAGSPSRQDRGGFFNGGFPDRMMNEEWWGIFRAEDNGFLPDILTPRALYYRLIALWNPVPDFGANFDFNNPSLVVEFERDEGDRDFRYAIEITHDLENWRAIADNEGSIALVAKGEENLVITETPEAGRVRIRVEDPGFFDRSQRTFLRAGVGTR